MFFLFFNLTLNLGKVKKLSQRVLLSNSLNLGNISTRSKTVLKVPKEAKEFFIFRDEQNN
jgi:hypothetical protein